MPGNQTTGTGRCQRKPSLSPSVRAPFKLIRAITGRIETKEYRVFPSRDDIFQSVELFVKIIFGILIGGGENGLVEEKLFLRFWIMFC